MALKESLQKLKDLVASMDGDFEKVITGNKSAAVRLRKVAQEVKLAAQQLRVDTQAGPVSAQEKIEQKKRLEDYRAEGPAPEEPIDEPHSGPTGYSGAQPAGPNPE